MDHQSREDGAHDGTDLVRLNDVVGIGDAEIVHHLQKREEVASPAVVAEE